VQQTALLFDHLVGKGSNRQWHCDAQARPFFSASARAICFLKSLADGGKVDGSSKAKIVDFPNRDLI